MTYTPPGPGKSTPFLDAKATAAYSAVQAKNSKLAPFAPPTYVPVPTAPPAYGVTGTGGLKVVTVNTQGTGKLSKKLGRHLLGGL